MLAALALDALSLRRTLATWLDVLEQSGGLSPAPQLAAQRAPRAPQTIHGGWKTVAHAPCPAALAGAGLVSGHLVRAPLKVVLEYWSEWGVWRGARLLRHWRRHAEAARARRRIVRATVSVATDAALRLCLSAWRKQAVRCAARRAACHALLPRRVFVAWNEWALARRRVPA